MEEHLQEVISTLNSELMNMTLKYASASAGLKLQIKENEDLKNKLRELENVLEEKNKNI